MDRDAKVVAIGERILARDDRFAWTSAEGVHRPRLFGRGIAVLVAIEEAAHAGMMSRALIIAIPDAILAAMDEGREAGAILAHGVEALDEREAVLVFVSEAGWSAGIVARIRIVAIPAPIGARVDIAHAVDLGAGAVCPFRLDAARFVEEREIIEVFIGIAAHEGARAAIAYIGRIRIADIGHAGVSFRGRAFDLHAGLAALSPGDADAALADGAEIVVEAFLIGVAAECTIELASIARDEVPIVAFLAGIDDAVTAGGRSTWFFPIACWILVARLAIAAGLRVECFFLFP